MSDINLKTALERISTLEMEIAQHKESEYALRKSEEQFRILVESTNDWLWEIDCNGLYTYISPQVEMLLGYKPEEVLGKSPFAFMPQKEAQRVGGLFKELLDRHEPIVALKNINLCKDGSTKTLETSGVAFFDKKGEFLGYHGIDRDITKREQAEQALRDSEEQLHSITSSAQDAILTMNYEGKISYWNEAAETMFGYPAEVAMGQLLHQLIVPERFLAAHYIGFEHFKKTGESPVIGKTVELFALKKDGTEFPIDLSLSRVMKNGQWNAIGIIRDITKRKEMESELKRKDEMMIAQAKQAAMTDMIAMLAHQWRQPLAVISMNINNIKASLELDGEITTEESVQCIDSVSNQVTLLAKTINDFSNYFKPNQSKEETTIKDVLNSTLSIIGKSLENNNIALTIQNAETRSLFINKSSLVQILLNILGNSKDILVSNHVKDAVINIAVNETEDTVTISVCDNAGGIEESIMDKIGQPYFTTKQKLNGTGLGIYISRTILEKHLFGTLTWHNKDKGACFVLKMKNRN